MLNRKDKISPWSEAAVYLCQKPSQVSDVVQCERAIGQVKRIFWQIKLLQIGYSVGNSFIRRSCLRPCQHLLGNIKSKHLRSPLLSSPAAEPAKAAAQIYDLESTHIGNHCSQSRPLYCAIQAINRAS